MSESVVGPWAKDKLDRLAKYLHAYTTIMKGQRWCEGYHYIDAFAGPGDYKVRHSASDRSREAQQALLDVSLFGREQIEQKQFLAGSPRVALDLQFPFTHYVFVEQSADRVASLERIKAEYGATRSIHVRKADCTKYLREKVAANPSINWQTNRAIVS